MRRTRREGFRPQYLGIVILAAVALYPASIADARVESSPPAYTYSGPHSDWVHRLLDRVGGWSCPEPGSDAAQPPKVRAEECIRDAYVAAAVQYAWAAECYARNEEDAKAGEAAKMMYEQLTNAQSLCSDAPTFAGASSCDTEKIFRCGELD
jgi:hypothetical protein